MVGNFRWANGGEAFLKESFHIPQEAFPVVAGEHRRAYSLWAEGGLTERAGVLLLCRQAKPRQERHKSVLEGGSI